MSRSHKRVRNIHISNNGKYCYKLALFTISLVLYIQSLAQSQFNLVPNPSFELHTVACNSITAGGGGATYWNNPVIFPTSSYGYSNSCAISNGCCGVPVNTSGSGYQWPHSGNGYAGFFAVIDDG